MRAGLRDSESRGRLYLKDGGNFGNLRDIRGQARGGGGLFAGSGRKAGELIPASGNGEDCREQKGEANEHLATLHRLSADPLVCFTELLPDSCPGSHGDSLCGL